MSDKKDKDKEKEIDKEDPHRQITPVLTGETQKIFVWLESLFELSPNDAPPGKAKSEPDSMPERIVMNPVYGMGGRERGIEMNPRTWKPSSSKVPSREALIALATEYYAKAKQHSTAVRANQRYCIFAYNNVKGPEAYDFHPFSCSPGPKDLTASREYGSGPDASDDEDTHRDRERRDERANARWMQEQFTESMTGIVKLLRDDNVRKADEIERLYAERRADRLAAEQALTQADLRKQAAEWAQTKNEVIKDVWGYAKSNFLPAVTAYLSKGKIGVQQMVAELFNSLSKEQKDSLLGDWRAVNGENTCVTPGVLDIDQVQLFIGVLTGDIDPARIADFITSLRQDQFSAAQQHLRPEQLQKLMTIAKIANDTSSNGAQA